MDDSAKWQEIKRIVEYSGGAFPLLGKSESIRLYDTLTARIVELESMVSLHVKSGAEWAKAFQESQAREKYLRAVLAGFPATTLPKDGRAEYLVRLVGCPNAKKLGFAIYQYNPHKKEFYGYDDIGEEFRVNPKAVDRWWPLPSTPGENEDNHQAVS